jgi:predicted amidophosphoribosyltransferase
MYERIGNSTDSLAPSDLVYDVCPNCNEDDFTEVYWCKCCENEYTEDDYCEKCLCAVVDHYKEAIDGIQQDTNGNREEVIEMFMEVMKEKINE